MRKTLSFILALLFLLPCLPASGDGALSCGSCYALGVRADGTVVSGGDSNSGKTEVEDWRDILRVDAASFHSAALKKDGTVQITPEPAPASVMIPAKEAGG